MLYPTLNTIRILHLQMSFYYCLFKDSNMFLQIVEKQHVLPLMNWSKTQKQIITN